MRSIERTIPIIFQNLISGDWQQILRMNGNMKPIQIEAPNFKWEWVKWKMVSAFRQFS